MSTQTARPSFRDAEKVAAPTLRDPVWIIISLTVWILSAVLMATWSVDVTFSDADKDFLGVMTASTFIAIIWGFAWLGVMRKMHSSIVKISLALGPILFVVLGVWSLAEGSSPVGFFVIAALLALWAYLRRDRIPFVTALLSAATTALVDMPGLMIVQAVSVILNVGWAIFYVFLFLFGWAYHLKNDGEMTFESWRNLLFACWLLYTYTTTLNQLTAHSIVCGTIASWWLTPNDLAPIGHATQRTFRYSFGSISLGAFIVFILETIDLVIGTWLDWGCLQCLWGWFKDLVKLYSSYCFVRVSVFNESFCDAAKHTNDLFKQSGLDALTNDTFIWVVLYLGSWLMGAIHGMVTVLLWGSMYSSAVFDSATYTYFIWLIGVWIGKNMTMACLMPIDSAVRTNYVLWSEASDLMNTNRPSQMGPILQSLTASTHYAQLGAGVPMGTVVAPGGVQGQPQEAQPQQAQPQQAQPQQEQV